MPADLDQPPTAALVRTRRDFLLRLGGYGGSTLAALTALGLMSTASGKGPELTGLPSVAGKTKRKVVILGGGLAGMCAAYELGKLGFDCTVLEPRAKAGGRCLTIRRGDVIEETNGHRQVCQFAEGSYFNPGPARFPQWHVTMDYCRELGVELEPFAGTNENTFVYNEGENLGPLSGKRVRMREAKADLRGQTAELLSKVAEQGALDQTLSAEDKTRLLDYLFYEGGLETGRVYKGHPRRGYEEWPGGGLQRGTLGQPHKLDQLLQSELWRFFHRSNEYEYQAQMFQPRGGMDLIAKALAARVGDRLILGAKAVEIRKTNPGVRVVYEHNGETKEIAGDFGVLTIPPPVLRAMPATSLDLSPALRNVINIVPFQNSGKVGLQFKRRFWEEDDRIFGGVTYTNLPIGEIWYPCSGYLGKTGVVSGYYVFGPVCDRLAAMTPEQRIEFALEHGSKIHPQYRAEFDNAVAFNWATEPHLRGCLAHFPERMLNTFYPVLLKPDGEYYVAASWASHLGGWQAGAFESARLAVAAIHQRAMASA